MKLLALAPTYPLPQNSGLKRRVYNVTRLLAQLHDIAFISFLHETPGVVGQPVKALPFCKIVETVRIKKTSALKRAIRSLPSRYPYQVTSFRYRRMSHQLSMLLARFRPDMILCDGLKMAQYVLGQPMPVVLTMHDADHQWWERFAETEKSLVVRWFAGLQAHRARRYQKQVLSAFAGCILVSEDDRHAMAPLVPDTCPVLVAPNGVDVNYFVRRKDAPVANTLVFCGSMNLRMNVDAMVYFCEAVLPLICEEVPSVQMVVVGHEPDRKVLELARLGNVTVTGGVPDVRPYFEQGTVFVAPIRQGGGIKLKVLEAMSMRIPVVATSVGCQGIDVEDGVHLLIADTPETFARQVVNLLGNPALCRQLAAAGRKLVERRYSWPSIVREIDQFLRQVCLC